MKQTKQLPHPPRVKPPKDQLLVHDGMTMSVRRKQQFPEVLVRILITVCGSIGTIGVLHGFFRFPVQLKPLFLFIVILTLIMRGLRMISPKLGFGSILAAFASIPLLLMRFREPAVAGAGAIYHIMRKRILWRISFPPNEVDVEGWTEGQCVQLVFILIIIALVALLEYSDVLLSHPQSSRSGFWIRFLVTFPFLECGLYFGIETYSICVFLLAIFWLGTLAVSRRKTPAKIAVRQGTSAPLQQAFSAETEQRFATHEPGAAALLLLSMVLTVTAIRASSNYARTADLDQKRDNIREFYHNLTIEDVTGLLESIPGDFGINVITDEVDLLSKSDLHFDGRPVLHLDIGAAAAPDDYYLRGIVRAEYTGHGWAIPAADYREQHKLFRRLTTANRMPQTIFHSDHVDELRTADGKFPVVSCDVTALNDERCNYLPYQSIYDIGTKYRYDIETELNSTKEYRFWIMNNAKLDWNRFTAYEAPSKNELVSEYEDFVMKEYLRVPETEAMRQLKEQALPALLQKNAPLIRRLDAIRDYIWARAEYTMQPGTQPSDRDFVDYFLNDSHKGYCAHYASAAVLLCRMCGIPARYCQGYVLTLDDFVLNKTDDDYSINIPDYQAHAWAEIYVKGYGWIPYEFTETVMDTWHRSAQAAAETTLVPVTTTTTTTTAVPPILSNLTTVTTTNPTAQDGSGTPGKGGLTPEQLAKLRKILLIVLAVMVMLLLYYALHRWITGKRQRAMENSDPNAAAHAAYTFIVQLLRMQGIEQEKLSHDEFSDTAEAQCKLLPAGRIRRAIDIQQAAVFSKNGIVQADAKVICKTATDLAKAMYTNAKPLRKLWLRWGRHIIK